MKEKKFTPLPRTCDWCGLVIGVVVAASAYDPRCCVYCQEKHNNGIESQNER